MSVQTAKTCGFWLSIPSEVANSDGTVFRVVTRPIVARTVTEEMRDRYREGRVAKVERDFFDLGELPPEVRNQMREVMDYDAWLRVAQAYPVYTDIPVIDDLRSTWTGGVWVRRTPEGGYPWENHVAGSLLSGLAFSTAPAPASAIDVISADGRYVGTFPLQASVTLGKPGAVISNAEMSLNAVKGEG